MKKVIFIIAILLIGFFLRPPVDGGRFSSWWGLRPGGLDGWFHVGSDIAHATGTPITPVSWGNIKQAGYCDLRGYYVIISHLGFLESRYYHLDTITTAVRESVDHKSVIGTVGDTGLSTGPHLHFEIRVFGIPLPAFLLSLPGRLFNMLGI